jgi:LysR family transcriptional regulator, flagellar master operon regulator
VDVDHARTLLAIIETGSFKEAASRLNLTQSAISARIKALEDVVGKQLLVRSKSGISLTNAGEHFYRHASTLVRVWRQAMLEMALADHHVDQLSIGAQLSLWEGFLLRWVAWMQQAHADRAVTASVGGSLELMDRLSEGSLDLAVVYRAVQRPGLVIEHLFDEELALVTSTPDARSVPGARYAFVNWGPEFAGDHAETYPTVEHTSLRLDLGAIAINYLLDTQASGYFPLRVARPYLADGRLRLVSRARRFVYPVYVVYPEERNIDGFDRFLDGLRLIADETFETAQH